jgi:hypothetical protein
MSVKIKIHLLYHQLTIRIIILKESTIIQLNLLDQKNNIRDMILSQERICHIMHDFIVIL